MKALVTGASGGIGAWLAKKLIEDGNEVVSILHDNRPYTTSKVIGVHDKISWAHGSILDERFVKRIVADYGVDTIFHLAALPLVQVGTRTTLPIFRTNILGTVNILEAIKENHWGGKDIRMVYMASDKIYGDQGEKPYTEDMPAGGLSIYDVSKACADLICQTYATCGYAPKVVIARPCNVIIPGDVNNLSRVLSRTVIPAMRGASPILYKTKYLREFIWIDDIVQALLMLDQLLVHEPERSGQAYNVGSGCQVNLEQAVYEVLSHFSGIQPTWTDPPALSRVEIPFQKLDSTKLRLALCWKPPTKFPEAIELYVDWWRKNWDTLPEVVRTYLGRDWHS